MLRCSTGVCFGTTPIYVNDTVDVAESSAAVKLFADDCTSFTPVNAVSDQTALHFE